MAPSRSPMGAAEGEEPPEALVAWPLGTASSWLVPGRLRGSSEAPPSCGTALHAWRQQGGSQQAGGAAGRCVAWH
jgi:hypothetical protein